MRILIENQIVSRGTCGHSCCLESTSAITNKKAEDGLLVIEHLKWALQAHEVLGNHEGMVLFQ